ncbi:MAG TPA: short-chain dehydrogenase [Planctomycetes bacterium]|nr:short-chain dehydrogenase [Planctomycetota bacterium]
MDLSLRDRHALVTGASAGIGRATALALAAQGATISPLARSGDKLAALCEELRAAGAPAAHPLVADLEDHEGLAAAVEGHLAAHGPVQVLVNNAGGPPGGPLLEAELSQFRQALDRLLFAPHLILQRVLPGMQEAGYGRIVNVISTSVYEPIPGLGVSNTTRGATAAWAKTISRELPPGITINNVLPGFTDTERLTTLAAGKAKRQGQTSEDVFSAWLGTVPEGRLARPDEPAGVIAFLCSPAGAYIRGQSLAVDGGRLHKI